MAQELRALISLCSILVLFSSILFSYINNEQQNPYMDEIFHIPQAQNYCHGNFYHWNDKITTLPGLYIQSLVLLYPLSFASSRPISSICNAFYLRLTNVFMLLGCFLVMYMIAKKLITKSKEEKEKQSQTQEVIPDDLKVGLEAFNLTIFPLLYFFGFLYYTDVGATFFVLVSYYLSLNERYVLSAFCGVIAVVFRQTNIIWTCFNAAASLLNYFTSKNILKNENIFDDIIVLVKNCFGHFYDVIRIALPYATVIIGFIVFVVKNNGIVVGDRNSHEASFNLPQVLYFSVFTMFFSSFIILRYRNFWLSINISVRRLSLLLITAALMFLAIYRFTYIHKYLLADNRHYTFYVWRKLYGKNWSVRYAMIPIYIISWNIIVSELGKRVTKLWLLLFVLSTAVVLIPQKLFEFRYYIVPYLMFRLHIKRSSTFEILVEGCLYFAINVVTFYLFLFQKFSWSHEEGVQRFIW